jgi:hypothetical protein
VEFLLAGNSPMESAAETNFQQGFAPELFEPMTKKLRVSPIASGFVALVRPGRDGRTIRKPNIEIQNKFESPNGRNDQNGGTVSSFVRLAIR